MRIRSSLWQEHLDGRTKVLKQSNTLEQLLRSSELKSEREPIESQSSNPKLRLRSLGSDLGREIALRLHKNPERSFQYRA